MTDRQIIERLLKRDESALKELSEKYDNYCYTVAYRILRCDSDTEECINDVWLAVWDSVPPEHPDDLKAFLSKVTRNIATARYRREHAGKRGGGEVALIVDELAECLPAADSAEDEYISAEFAAALDRFYAGLPKRERDIFMCRYYHACSTGEIASVYGIGENHVRSILSKTRKKLSDFIKKEGLL